MAFSLALGVTPESLKSKSTEVSADIDDMNTEIQILISEVQETSQYWLGDAGSAERSKMEENIDALNTLITRLRTYPSRLLTMAGIYETAEDDNIATASATKTDIVMF